MSNHNSPLYSNKSGNRSDIHLNHEKKNHYFTTQNLVVPGKILGRLKFVLFGGKIASRSLHTGLQTRNLGKRSTSAIIFDHSTTNAKPGVNKKNAVSLLAGYMLNTNCYYHILLFYGPLTKGKSS